MAPQYICKTLDAPMSPVFPPHLFCMPLVFQLCASSSALTAGLPLEVMKSSLGSPLKLPHSPHTLLCRRGPLVMLRVLKRLERPWADTANKTERKPAAGGEEHGR